MAFNNISTNFSAMGYDPSQSQYDWTTSVSQYQSRTIPFDYKTPDIGGTGAILYISDVGTIPLVGLVQCDIAWTGPSLPTMYAGVYLVDPITGTLLVADNIAESSTGGMSITDINRQIPFSQYSPSPAAVAGAAISSFPGVTIKPYGYKVIVNSTGGTGAIENNNPVAGAGRVTVLYVQGI